MTNFSEVDYNAVEAQMDAVYNYVVPVYQDDDRREKSMLEKRELISYIHNYLIGCLRRVRASNFTSGIVEIIEKYYKFLSSDERESYKKLTTLKHSF